MLKMWRISNLKNVKRLCCGKNYSNLWGSEKSFKSSYEDVNIPNRTIVEQIWENLEKWPDKTAAICAVTNQSYTYHQLYKYSRNLAARLRSRLSIEDGDVICIMMHNCPQYALAVLGSLQAGAQVTTLNPIYTASEAKTQILLSLPKAIIVDSEAIPTIQEALSTIPQISIKIISMKNRDYMPYNVISFEELIEDNNVDHSVLREVRRTVEDVALLPYSSGTTGLPKGVELTNKSVVANLVQQNVPGVKYYNDTTNSCQDSGLAVLPFYHIYGLSVIMLHKLSAGLKIVTLPKFKPNTLARAVKEHNIKVLFAAPPLVLFLGSYPGVTKEIFASVDSVICGGAPLPLKDINTVLEKSRQDFNFIQIYGLTETSPIVTTSKLGTTNYASVGAAVSNTELKIVDSESQALNPNEVGELYIRGPQVMKGYKNKPEATRAAITEDGWFKTGDLASIDEKGYVYIKDRLKELIKVKGYQVAPAELENVIKEHPDVLDTAVIGVPDAKAGEVPKAFVVLRPGHKADAANISEFVNKRVAEFKRIKQITFIDSLPKNPSGKLLRRELRDSNCNAK